VRPAQLIVAKRDGQPLDPAAITDLVSAYAKDEIPDYQMAAFLMAVFFRGMTDEEAAALTRAMLHSGEVLDLSDLPGTKVDKHSTGGVGDKVSLILAPLVAACGVPVPMISGRGLGHTGGTLDKLEAIPGFRTDLGIPAYRDLLQKLNVVMIGQTAEIAPADKRVYALRDVTGTVESIPLIAASIMSKKLAEGIDALVLDVKVGRGAFMKTEEQARKLAETLVGIGREFGKPTIALLTGMDVPLGRAVGNGPETAEAIRILRGEDEGRLDDVLDVTLALAGEMVWLGGEADSPEAGRKKAEEVLASGAALETFRQLVEAQDGDASMLDHPEKLHGDPVATVTAPESGVVTDIDAYALAVAVSALGAGRARKEDDVDPKAGVVIERHVGERVGAGDVLLQVYASDASRVDEDALRSAFSFGSKAPDSEPLVRDRFDGERWANG
jgi:pyrimidine-nucleoside phosphorylase